MPTPKGSPEGPRDLVGYLLPKTVVGLALWLLFFALGASLSGVVFFVVYERRQTDLQNQLTTVRTQLEQELNDAVTQLQNADKAIQGGATGTALGPLGGSGKVLTAVGPSMVVVKGVDANGARTSGSGFILQSSAYQSWILTSYQLLAGSVAASQQAAAQQAAAQQAAAQQAATPAPTVAGGLASPTQTALASPTQTALAIPTPTTQTAVPSPAPLPPPPTVIVTVAGADHTATAYSWDATRNLALVIVDVGSLPVLQYSNAVATAGLDVWAMSASGGQFGATAAQGQVVTATPQGITTTAAVGPQATGGPLVDQEGKVVGVLFVPVPAAAPGSPPPKSAPPSVPAAQAGMAIPIRLSCLRVVICPR